jgi:hypothetical protein
VIIMRGGEFSFAGEVEQEDVLRTRGALISFRTTGPGLRLVQERLRMMVLSMTSRQQDPMSRSMQRT